MGEASHTAFPREPLWSASHQSISQEEHMAGHLEDISIGPLASPALREGFRWEPSPRRVRVELGGETVADSRHVMLLHEAGRLPVFYFPQRDVRMDLLARTDRTSTSPLKGTATW